MRRRIGIGLLLGGSLALVALAQLGRPGRVPPLYDGVVVVEPYRWVVPPAGAPGSPGSFAQSEGVQNGTNPAFAATTPETPPQAQLLVPQGAFAVPAGTLGLQVDIAPIGPPVGASIVGNAYRFAVTGPGGAPVAIRPESPVTIALRAPSGTTDARIVRLDSTAAAEALTTVPSGETDTYLADVEVLGTFAIVGAASDTRTSQVLLTLGILLAVGLGGLGLLWVRDRRDGAGRRLAASRAAAASRTGVSAGREQTVIASIEPCSK